MKLYTLLVLLISLGLLEGCTTTKPFRDNYRSACEYNKKGDCSKHFISVGKQGSKKQYYLSFIEYDDQGQLLNPMAEKSVADFYRKIVEQDNVMLITFVHGWHHNANGSPEDTNIVDFRHLLELAAWEENRVSELTQRKPKTIVGLYLGWRGRSLNGFLDYLTFWDRKSTAQEVGYQGIAETLLEFEGMVKPKQTKKSENTMITIGHSFGGAALYSAIHPILTERYVSSRPHKSASRAEGFGDLVLLLNPAFEAMRYGSLYELSQGECTEYPEDQLPKLLILSSYADKPVRLAFQVGRLPVLLLEKHRKTKVTRCDQNGENFYDLNQGRADVLAVGHFDPYVTHYLRAKDDSVSMLSTDTKLMPKDAWFNQVQSESGEINFSGTVLKSKGRTRTLNPYMNVFTDKEVIGGHNDIWNRKVRYFVKDIISIMSSNN